MKFSLSWLRQYLDTEASIEAIAAKLNAIGLEVESIDDPAAKLAGFRIAKVLTENRHPDADKLQVLTVDAGDGVPLQVVCGAPNARAGLVGVLGLPGDIRVDLKALPATIGSKRLSFGKADDLLRLLGLTPGSVTPLAAINDTDGAVTVVLDRAVAAAPCFHVHPLRNSASLALAGPDLVRALGAWGHVPAVVAVPGL